MKEIIIFGSFILMSISSLSQSAKVNSLKESDLHPLDVGDLMPDIPLGNIKNNLSGKSRFSEFKGKLVILDFWITHCGPCIEAFPEMEKLQKEFNNKIQIFIVTPDSEEDINKARAFYSKAGHHLPGLPSISNAKKLTELFQVSGYPHHVWIDGEGKIIVNGSSINTNESSIFEFLAGKQQFNSIRDVGMESHQQKGKPFYLQLDENNLYLKYGSYFTPFNYNYTWKSYKENVVDSATGTMRNTFINYDILSLALEAFKNQIKSFSKDILLSNINGGPASLNDPLNQILLYTRDTIKYTSKFREREVGRKITDQEIIRSKFCYEQVLPSIVGDTEIQRYMQQDLNNFFGSVYNIQIGLETKTFTCLALRRCTEQDKLGSQSTDYSRSHIIQNNIKYKKYNCIPFNDAFYRIMSSDTSFLNNQFHPLIIVNETDFTNDKKVDVCIPENIDSENDLKELLNSYGLILCKEEKKLSFLVLREKNFKN